MHAQQPAQSGILFSEPGVLPAWVEAWKNVLHLGDGLDDSRLVAEFGNLSGAAADHIPPERTAKIEAYAAIRLAGQKETIAVRVAEPTREHLRRQIAGGADDVLEIVILRLRRISA